VEAATGLYELLAGLFGRLTVRYSSLAFVKEVRVSAEQQLIAGFDLLVACLAKLLSLRQILILLCFSCSQTSLMRLELQLGFESMDLNISSASTGRRRRAGSGDPARHSFRATRGGKVTRTSLSTTQAQCPGYVHL
jgi:hypothetical protein